MASRFKESLVELKRRKVYHVAIVYLVVGFGVASGAQYVFEMLGFPVAAAQFVAVLIILGLPIALVLAWAYEVRPEPGLHSPQQGTPAADDAAARESSTPEELVAPGTPGGRSVAVLPFESLSPDPEGDYFADGITEELTNALAKQAGLRVAARTSAFAFKGEHLDVREIGTRLNVSHVIEGSIRRSGETLRITAQLIDTQDGYHLWSQQFDRDLGDVFRIQEEIAGKVAEGLRDGVSPEVKPEVPSTKLSAYEAFLRGRHALATFAPQTLAKAIQEFEACIAIDDGYAPAHAGLADALTNQAIGFSDHPPRQSMTRAREAAARALELDPDLAEGHLARALVRMWHEFDYEGAKAGFDRALEINPNFADVHLWLEFYWTYVRFDFQEALATNRRAHRLSPLDTRAAVRLGTLYMVFGRLEEAERYHREALAEVPEAPVSLLGLGDTLFRQGRYEEAVSQVLEAMRIGGRPTPWLGMLAGFYGAAGYEEEARKALAEMGEREKDGYVSGFWMAAANAGLRQYDEAFSYLNRAVEERDSNLLYLFVVPRRWGMHDRPEFPEILNRIGLPHLADLI